MFMTFNQSKTKEMKYQFKNLSVSGSRMFSLIGILALFFFLQQPVHAQFGLAIHPNTTQAEAEAMIQNIFISGDVQVSNIQYTGYPQASGEFIGVTGVGFNHGMILTSGLATIAIGPNNQPGAGNSNGAAGDADLALLAGVNSFNACVLSFDFVPKTEKIKFRYVFGSEEYPEYVDQFNDMFGFFLSGPGISGPYSNNAINIALIPGTSTPVSINTVNIEDNNQYFVANSPTIVNNIIQYDGYTTPLYAEYTVVPCQTYRIKLAISDGGDPAFDSGVFLEANSFSDGSVNTILSFTNDKIDTMAVEQCNDANIVFDIQEERETAYSLPLMVGGTATEGEDYPAIPHTIFIPPGERFFEVNIEPYQDNIAEAPETVVLKFKPDICNPFSIDSVVIKIYDKGIHHDTTSKFYSTCGQDVLLTFQSELDGTPPYEYNWIDLGNLTDPEVNYSPVQDSIALRCLITDACGQQALDTAIVVIAPVNANAGIDQSLCNDPTVTIGTPEITGYHYAWYSDPVDATLAGQENLAQPVVGPAVTTRYWVDVTNDCDGADTDETWVLLEGAVAYAGENQEICLNESATFSANDAVSWQWTCSDPSVIAGQETNQVIDVTPSSAGTYVFNLTVTNDCGFTADASVSLVVHPLPNANAGIDNEICLGESYQLNASGGGNYEWWSVPNDPSLFVGDQHLTQNPTVTPTGTSIQYFVGVTSSDGCYAEDEMMLVLNPSPVIDAQVDDNLICKDGQTTLRAIGTANFTWTANPPGSIPVGSEHDPVLVVSPAVGTTTYTLLGEATGYDCPTTKTVDVTVRPEVTATIQTVEDFVCQDANFQLIYQGNAPVGADYFWDFDGATITSGSGPGLYNIKWATAGDKNVTVYVDDNGCLSQVASRQITVYPSPQSAFSSDITDGCLPITVQFADNSTNLGQNVTYAWDFGNGTTSSLSSPSVVYDQPGDYTVSLTVTNEGLCQSAASQVGMISSYANPVAGFTPNPESTTIREPVIVFSNSSTGDGLTYEWDFGDGTTSTESQPTHTYTETGTYDVVLHTTTVNGCTDETTMTVEVFPDYAVFPASAFTPNGDGLNDFFEVKSVAVAKFNIKVYSRWGQVIFESDDLETQWDGKVKGEYVPAGSYIYDIIITNMVGETMEKRGTVSVVR